MSRLLIVIDMQVDFVTGVLGTKEAVGIISNVKAAIDRALSKGAAVIFTKDTHDKNYLYTQEGKHLPVSHCIKGTNGWQLVQDLRNYETECPVVEKGTFGSLELAEFVKRNLFDEIELVGVCTDICVISNAIILKASLPEAQITVLSDCCAGASQESHANALEAMKMCQIVVK